MRKQVLVALGVVTAISPAFAAQTEPVPGEGAPAAPADAKYCIHVEPITGSRIEMVQCETRQEWALLGVDVDREWAKEGVRVVS
jgi:hypothetical protein